MHDKLTAGLDKSKMSVEQLLAAARRASIAINAKIEEQRKVIDGVNSELDRMQRKLQAVKPGAGQEELLAEVSACKKVLAEEVGVLQQLEKEHRQAGRGVAQLEQEYRRIAVSGKEAEAAGKSLTDRIKEQKAVIRQVEADVKALQKAYEKAAPGNAQSAALAELNAAKKALEEDKMILRSLTEEQERNRESNRRLSLQLRELQDSMARMRLNGEGNTEQYALMARKAAELSDTLGDLRAQTNILAHDDANLQGFISGVNGLSGAFTTATGVMSLFASENEDLMKVQARVQSVMAITMGLQQAFSALNRDSAFRLVTVAKAKALLTAANYRLATSLGISNAAATALMATLTLGLSVVITGLIVAWNKLSDAQEEAARKARERVETESQGRAEMIKTRFEIDTTRESLRNFTGSKEEEKKKCEELNRKYGEAFGYYDTVDRWYDVLTQKAEDYIQMLFLQAKAQAFVNKAMEADEKLNRHNATKPGSAETDMGLLQQAALYTTGLFTFGAGTINAIDIVNQQNKEAYEKRKQELKVERDSFLNQAADLERQAAAVGKGAGIGGHADPNRQKNSPKNREENTASEQLALMRKNRQAEIDLLKEGSEKKRRQIRENYQTELEELAAQERKWRDAQKGHLTKQQSDTLETSRNLAQQKLKSGEEEIAQEEAKQRLERQENETQAMIDYLKEYGSFQQKRLAIAQEYEEKIRKSSSVGERASLAIQRDKDIEKAKADEISMSVDWDGIFSELQGHTKQYLQGLRSQLQELLNSGSLPIDQMQTVSEKISAIDDELSKQQGIWGFIGERAREHNRLVQEAADAQERLKAAEGEEARAGVDLSFVKTDIQERLAGVGLDMDIKDISTATLNEKIDLTDEKFRGMAERIQRLAVAEVKLTEARKRTAAATSDARHAEDGAKRSSPQAIADWFSDTQDFITKKGIDQLPDLLKSVGLDGIGDKVSNGLDAVNNAAGAAADFASGNYIGAALKGISALKSFGNMLGIGGGNAAEVEKSINRLTERNELLEQSIRDLTEEMEKSRGVDAIKISIDADKLQKETNDNYKSIAQEQARYHKNHKSFNYYWKGYSQEQTKRLSEQIGRQWNGDIWDLSPEEMKKLRSNVDMWEQIVNTGKGNYGGRVAEKLNAYIEQAGKLQEITDTLYENLTTTTKENVFDDFLDSLYGLANGSEEVFDEIAENWQAMVNRMVVNNLVGANFQKKIESWYKDLAELNKKRTGGEVSDTEYRKHLDSLKKQYEEYVKSAQNDIESLRDNGIIKETDKNGGTAQTGKAGAFATMSQDQATKLEGLFVSGQMHWASIDDRVEDVASRMDVAQQHLKKIEDNTGSSAASLIAIKEEIKKIVRDGIKVK